MAPAFPSAKSELFNYTEENRQINKQRETTNRKKEIKTYFVISMSILISEPVSQQNDEPRNFTVLTTKT
jgi:hypothetical protein